MLWGERRGQWHHRRSSESTERPMPHLNDLSRSLVILEQDATLIAVIEMGQASWLVAGIVPGVERSPLKKLAVDESALLKLLNRWREEAEKAGHRIERIAIAFEAGRDGFWLARWLRARGWRRRLSGNIGRMIWPRVARPFQDNSSGAVRGIVERRMSRRRRIEVGARRRDHGDDRE
jgi:hypothetical protein